MISSMIYPDGKSHAFAYDGVHGRLRQIDQGLSGAEAPFVTGLDYNLSGQVTEMRYGNGTRQDWSFDNRKRIERIRVTGPQGTIEDLHYILSPSGNIMAINDNEYSYDGFNRISGAKTKLPETKDLGKLVAGHYGTYQVSDPSGVSNFLGDADLNHDGRINGVDQILSTYTHQDELYDIEAFAYDQNGNRTKLTQGGDEYSYVFGLRNQLASIHLKKKGQTSKALFASYEYDANGNTTKRTIYGGSKPLVTVFIYDIMNRLISTVDNGKVTKYAYDNANNRLYKQGPDGLTLYLRHGQIAVAMDIEVYAASSEDGKSMLGRVNRYVLSGDLLAGRSTMVYNLDGTTMQRLSYYHLDHLNSTKSVSDLRGQMEVQYLYRAFGEQLRRLGTGNATYTYGGKELDSLTNLYYFNARYYDATTGRFINVDPIQDGANWYVYCSNNPLGFKDPTGLIQVEIDPVTDEKNKLAASAEKASTGSPISTGKLTSAFGVYDYYKKDGTYVQKQHNGVDFAAPDGTPIKAIKDGTISGVKANIDGHGNSVEIDHGNGLKTVSSHMNAKPQWEVGDPVAKGATIGQVGNTSATGASTGPHLHFETILNGKPVDPISILGGVTKGVTPQIEKGYVKHDSSGKYQNWLLK
jgi:RHS repeat-associated protein